MKKYNILIVEDEYINAQFIERAVLKLGHNVLDSVETGEEAIEICKKQNIHLVFMDINLENSMDGIACAKKINKHKVTPIIYTTAFSDSQTIDEATNTNLFGYLIKPFDFHDIEATLNLTLKKNYINKVNKKTTQNKNASLFTLLGTNYRYYAKTKTLLKNETPIELTKKESNLFYYLFNNLNQNVTTNYLCNYVWDNRVIADSTIRDTVLRLRKKIPGLSIRTISGVGYSLENR